MFASGYATYESLSKPLQAFLETLHAQHIGANYKKSYLAKDDGPKAVHPVVVTHPETGRKSIFVREPDVVQTLGNQMIEVVASTPEQYNAYVREEIRRWKPVIERQNIVVDK